MLLTVLSGQRDGRAAIPRRRNRVFEREEMVVFPIIQHFHLLRWCLIGFDMSNFPMRLLQK
jgi:hypothetical protein